jgi:predicted nucleic acid-binding Zn ribbon protein
MARWERQGAEREAAPMTLGESLGHLTKRLGLAAPDTLGTIFAGWHDVVGASLAEHVKPVSLYEGSLTVSVSDPAWATHVRYLHDDLLARLAQQAGAGTVTEIVVTVSRGGRRSKRSVNTPHT